MDDEIDIRTRYDHRLANVKTEIEFNWAALGEHFIRTDSERQARFLLGWEAEADALGHLSENLHYYYIADALPDERTRTNIAEQLRRLADFLSPEEVAQ
ncbi:hypothetical protein [Pseudactinotalea sp. Z1748]|uniref:hypothetical protein n=1 Tax=Pseudactinotalea sp. Z1748 TaxID=3413027 RepID=UPI003C7D6356